VVADINPCGAVVDFIRRTYRTTAKPFSNSDQTAEMVWYPALEGAPTLPFSTTFNTGDQNPVFIDKTSAGEVYDAPRPFEFTRPKAHALGVHQCGSAAAFVDGVPYDPEQVIPYNDDGLPVCCNGWERGPCSCSAPGAEVEVVPVPGATCAAAIELTPIPGGGSYPVPYAFGQHDVWVAFDWPIGVAGTLRMDGTAAKRLYRGGDCNSLTQVGSIDGPVSLTYAGLATGARFYALWDSPSTALTIWLPLP
jgi:hypothetical protein